MHCTRVVQPQAQTQSKTPRGHHVLLCHASWNNKDRSALQRARHAAAKGRSPATVWAKLTAALVLARAGRPCTASTIRLPSPRHASCLSQNLTGVARTVTMRRACRATRPAGRGAAVVCMRTLRRLIAGAVVAMAAMFVGCSDVSKGSQIMLGWTSAVEL